MVVVSLAIGVFFTFTFAITVDVMYYIWCCSTRSDSHKLPAKLVNAYLGKNLRRNVGQNFSWNIALNRS